MSGTPPGTTEVRPVVRRRVAQRRRRLRRLTLAQAGFTLIAAVVLVALVWVGWRSAMRITGGRDELVTDPAAPGYVGEVLPTDVTLLAVTGDGGELISMLVLVDDEGASGLTAVPMSPHLVLAGFEDGPAEAASSVFADGGIDVLQLRLGADLGFGSTDALVVPGAVLVELVRSVGPLTVHLADDVFEAPVDADPAHPGERLPTQVRRIARDPLDPRFDDRAFRALLRGTDRGIKAVLLDQRAIAGIGNIYADEALWRTRLHWAQPARTVSTRKANELLAAVRDVFVQALAEGGTSFDDLYVNVNGESGYFERSLQAYGRAGEPCARCGRPLVREPFANRSSFRCPRCQGLRGR